MWLPMRPTRCMLPQLTLMRAAWNDIALGATCSQRSAWAINAIAAAVCQSAEWVLTGRRVNVNWPG